MGRWQRRALLARQALRRRWAWLRWELARRSEVFRRLFVARRAATDRSCSCTDRLIFSAALLGLCLSLLAALPAVVLLGVLLPFGTLFPIVQLVLSLATPHDSAILLLPWTLSAIHLALVAMMATLAPLVHRFQSLWADLLPTEGLPAAFFSPVFVEQIRKRHERALGAQPVFWDYECPICCAEIAPEDAQIVDTCSHAFHAQCIDAWLQEQHTCPLCRCQVHPSECHPFVSTDSR